MNSMLNNAETHSVPPIHELNLFLLKFVTTLLATGSQPSRVLRSAQRIGNSFGFDVDMLIMHKHMIMTLYHRDAPEDGRTTVRAITPAPFNFTIMHKLNLLSWHAHDKHLSLETMQKCYAAIMHEPRSPWWLVGIMLACANAAFCRLFQGDALAVWLVGLATLCAVLVRHPMQQARIDYRVIFIVAAFVSSMLTALGVMYIPTTTPDVALATSVLFLIPGVPLVNAINDIMEGYVLLGFARAINASILVICIAIGLSATLLIIGGEMV